VRIDVVEFGGREQRGEDGPSPAAAIRSREEGVLARDGGRIVRSTVLLSMSSRPS
jgi:hypothetical protein